MKRQTALVLALIVGIIFAIYLARNTPLEVNQAEDAPDKIKLLEGLDLHGNHWSIKKQGKNKVILVTAWASWCQPCLQKIPHEKMLIAKYKNKPFEIVGINGDSDIRNALRIEKQYEIPWKNLVQKQSNGNLLDIFEVNSFPNFFLYDKKGKLRYSNINTTPEQLDNLIETLINE